MGVTQVPDPGAISWGDGVDSTAGSRERATPPLRTIVGSITGGEGSTRGMVGASSLAAGEAANSCSSKAWSAALLVLGFAAFGP